MNASWQVFHRHAARYDAWFQKGASRLLFPAEVEAIGLLLQRVRPPTLEVGVGSGAFATALEVTVGVDPALGALRLAKAKGVTVVRALGEALPFPNGLFGGVLFISTLCFAADPLALLREGRRVLREDGGAIVADVVKDSAWGRFYLGKKASGHLFYRHANFYTVAELRELLARAGLQTTAFSSTLTQPPRRRLRREKAFSGLVADASFVCLLALPAQTFSSEQPTH